MWCNKLFFLRLCCTICNWAKQWAMRMQKKPLFYFFLLQFVVFSFVTCVNAFVKRQLFQSGKKYKRTMIWAEKISNVITFKESASIDHILPMPIPKNCWYLPMPINWHIPNSLMCTKEKNFLPKLWYSK